MGIFHEKLRRNAAVTNADLQAGQHILSILEKAKVRSDRTLDELPGVYAVIDSKGVMIKGNQGLATLLGVDVEALLGRSLSELFDPNHWRAFLESVETAGQGHHELELPIIGGASYLWETLPFDGIPDSQLNLRTVFGKNIQDYKYTQSKLISLQKDLEITQAIQTLLLPKRTSYVGSGVELAAFYRPASNAGGDWWWHETGPADSTLVFLADVLGHGAGPAMLTSLIAGSCHTVAAIGKGGVDSIVQTYFEVFHQALRHFCAGDYWMTMTVAEVLPAKDLVRVWNTGGPTVFYLGSDGSYQGLRTAGSPIGAGELQIGQTSHAFLPGDRILLYTDGMHHFDNHGDSGSQGNGLGQLRKSFIKTHGLSTCAARDAIQCRFVDKLAGASQLDDAAFIVVDRKT